MTNPHEASAPAARPRLIYIIALSSLMAFGPLGIDLYLPSLPAIKDAFNTDMASVQMTFSLFLLGFGLGQLAVGPLADRFGRMPVMLVGVLGFAVASILCATAPTIETLWAARLLQGLSAAIGPIISRAIVRDKFDGAMAASLFGYLGAIMAIVPMLAPMVGGVMQSYFGWTSNFWTILALALLILVLARTTFDETLPVEARRSVRPAALLASWFTLLKDPLFVAYVGVASFLFAGLMTFVGGSSFVVQSVYGYGPIAYSLLFGLMVTGFMGGAIITGRWTQRVGSARMLSFGMTSLVIGSVIQLATASLDMMSITSLIVAQLFFALGMGLTNPQVSAGALQNFPHMAGTAASLMGAVPLAASSLGGVILGLTFNGTAAPMTYQMGVLGLTAFCIWFLFIRPREAQIGY